MRQSIRMSHRSRNGEPPRAHFRSEDRCFMVNQWFLATREGIDVGPFPTRAAVEDAAKDVIALLKRADDPIIAAVRLQEFVHRLNGARELRAVFRKTPSMHG